jgi:hypothetical protein
LVEWKVAKRTKEICLGASIPNLIDAIINKFKKVIGKDAMIGTFSAALGK